MKKNTCPQRKVLLSVKVFKISLGNEILNRAVCFHRPNKKLPPKCDKKKNINKRPLTLSISQIRYNISWNDHMTYLFQLKLYTLLMTLVTLLSILQWWQPSLVFLLFLCMCVISMASLLPDLSKSYKLFKSQRILVTQYSMMIHRQGMENYQKDNSEELSIV